MHRLIEPHPKLKKYIVFFAEIKWSKGKDIVPINNYCLPTGCSFMGFHLHGRMDVIIENTRINNSQFYVNQQTTSLYRLESRDNALHLLVACLKPTALYHIFGKQDISIIDKSVGLHHLLGKSFEEFKNRYLESNSIEECIDVVQDMFLSFARLNKSPLNFIDEAIDICLHEKGTKSIGEIVTRLNVSERYFQKKFKSMVGITAIKYRNIVRLLYVFSYMENNSLSDCKTLATLLNFYDTAHFSRAFKEITGKPPSQFKIEDHPFIQYSTVENLIWSN